ncbi:MAG: aminoacyl-histidine dipeptidase, partial [Eubacteriales bacterium]|nr:aminoacyl-histidine dipeptidase [Eubacteriales bacterium]
INELKSERVFHFFEEISKIPRASYNEKEISEYLVNFAKSRKLEYYTDEVFNVIIKKGGTLGFENAPIIAIQGHTDMVCEKNKDIEHDFSKDPIKLIYEGDILKADNTTLGADNGIAVAMALALLDSDDIPHPPIEAIFTASEETGMEGATFIDATKINSRILLNIDSEDEGVFTVGCAGGVKADIELPIEKISTNSKFTSYLLNVTGLFGGHSGVDVTKGRANSNKLLIRTIKGLRDKFEIELSKISGGSKDNAIPREAEAIISFDSSKFNEAQNIIKKFEETFIAEHIEADANIKLSITEIEKQEEAFTEDTLNKLILAIYLLPNGVQTMSTTLEGLPESSMNVGVITCLENEILIVASIRSAVVSKKIEIMERVSLLIGELKGKVQFRGDYPAWEHNPNSKLKEKCTEVYKKLTGEDPKIDIIHAGLECGLLSEKLPDMDLISFGPNIYYPHSPSETVSISSVDRVWEFLLCLIKELN